MSLAEAPDKPFGGSRSMVGFAACPVCRDPAHLVPFCQVGPLPYWRCTLCKATLLDPSHHVSADAERAHYLTHENDAHDERYLTHLRRLTDPLLKKLHSPSKGLDFGCGPGPALNHLCERSNHQVTLYDLHFAPDEAALDQTYDFLTATEVIEHLVDPAGTFDLFERLVGSGGLIGLMTCFQTEDARFANWTYRRDPTHIVFYRAETFHVIGQKRGWRLEIPAKDVVLIEVP